MRYRYRLTHPTDLARLKHSFFKRAYINNQNFLNRNFLGNSTRNLLQKLLISCLGEMQLKVYPSNVLASVTTSNLPFSWRNNCCRVGCDANNPGNCLTILVRRIGIWTNSRKTLHRVGAHGRAPLPTINAALHPTTLRPLR